MNEADQPRAEPNPNPSLRGRGEGDFPSLDIDWRAYFLDFCNRHGGAPVLHGRDRLLFRDGWMYSAREYRGPEWRAPDDPKELRVLQLAYWTIRREEVRNYRLGLIETRNAIKSLMDSREGDIPVRKLVWNDQGDAMIPIVRPMRLEEWDAQIERVDRMLSEAETELERLGVP